MDIKVFSIPNDTNIDFTELAENDIFFISGKRMIIDNQGVKEYLFNKKDVLGFLKKEGSKSLYNLLIECVNKIDFVGVPINLVKEIKKEELFKTKQESKNEDKLPIFKEIDIDEEDIPF